MQRFGVAASYNEEVKEREKKARAYRDALDRLLISDPEFRPMYEELGAKLHEAETGADNNIADLEAALLGQQAINQGMRDAAAKLPGGKAVFRYADGRVIDEDRNGAPPEIADGIIWPESAPSAEDYFTGLQREADIRTSLEDWRTYRNDTLGGIRNSYDDREIPMSKDEMRDALEEIEAARPTKDTGAAASPIQPVRDFITAPKQLLTLDS